MSFRLSTVHGNFSAQQLIWLSTSRPPNAYRTARLSTGVVDRLLSSFGLGDHRHAVPVIDFADLGHPEMPGRALQEPAPQPFFQQRNTAAERGFRHAKRTPRTRATTMLNHPGEIVEMVEVLHLSVPFLERTVPNWTTTGKFVPSVSLRPTGPSTRSTPTE